MCGADRIIALSNDIVLLISRKKTKAMPPNFDRYCNRNIVIFWYIHLGGAVLVEMKIKTRALWFVKQEIEIVLGNLESGVINKDQAIGSLSTAFNISSGVKDVRHMKTICKIISYIRSTNYYMRIKKMYLSNYFDESPYSPDEEKGIV